MMLVLLATSCAVRPAAPATAADVPEPPERLLALGKHLYEAGEGAPPCASCHQADGRGLRGAFPPLAVDRPWMTDCVAAAAIVRAGLTGPITIEGQRYEGVMVPYGDRWTDRQVAAVISYARRLVSDQAATCAPVDLASP